MTRAVIVGGGAVVAGSEPESPSSDSSEQEAGAGSSDTTPSAVSDVEPPIIELIGEAALEITVGGFFLDPGATAIDPSTSSGQAIDLTENILVSGAVDTATEGLYTITYSVLDASGNAASVSRVVTVLPPAPAPEPEPELDSTSSPQAEPEPVATA